ncbi:MAG: phosphate ABC transporter permease PstA [Chloroflexota bacterium]
MSTYAIRKGVNVLGTGLSLACALLAIIPLGAMLIYVVEQGGSSINLAFFTHTPAPMGDAGGGVENGILGTLMLVGIGSIFGLPIGILGGVYLARSTNVSLSRVVRFITDVIAGTPSIIAGLVAYALVVVPMGGFSGLAGGVALGLLMFPTVTRATEEAIKLVPGSIREAALALGLPEWKTMMLIIIPAAINGIITAIMLGIARVAGETAPLVFTALGNDALPTSPLKPIGALPLVIWNYAQTPYASLHQQAWAGALTLFAIVVLVNVAARILTYRLSKRVASV